MSTVPPPPPPYTSSQENLKQPPKPEKITPVVDEWNPGPYEELHKKCKEVFPHPFEGARLIINKGLSSVFQISHSLTMSALQPSGYKFSCTYVGPYQFSATESYPVMLGEMDFSGSFGAQIIHQLNKNIKLKYLAQVQNNKWLGNQLTAEYKGFDYVASVTAANLDVLKDSGMLIFNYLQNVTKKLALGVELMYQSDVNIPGHQASIVSFATRYSGLNWQFSSTFTPITLALKSCFWQKSMSNVQFGIELDGSLATQECTTALAYQVDLPKSDVIFKGQIDSNLCVGAVFEKRLPPLPFSLTLSALANHVKGAYRFGIGFTLG